MNLDKNYVGICPYCGQKVYGCLFDQSVRDLKKHMLTRHKKDLEKQFQDHLTGAAIKAINSVLQGE